VKATAIVSGNRPVRMSPPWFVAKPTIATARAAVGATGPIRRTAVCQRPGGTLVRSSGIGWPFGVGQEVFEVVGCGRGTVLVAKSLSKARRCRRTLLKEYLAQGRGEA
jgi:transposase